MSPDHELKTLLGPTFTGLGEFYTVKFVVVFGNYSCFLRFESDLKVLKDLITVSTNLTKITFLFCFRMMLEIKRLQMLSENEVLDDLLAHQEQRKD